MRFFEKFKMNTLHYFAMTYRYISIILSDKLSFITLILQAPIMLLIIFLTCKKDFTYYNAMMTLFVIVTIAITMAILNSYREVCKERDILKREYDAGLNPISYILSKITVQSIICLFQTLIIVTGVLLYLDINYDPGKEFQTILLFYVIIFLTYMASTSFGIMISSVLKNSESAVLPVLFLIISQVVLSGALDDLPKSIEWVSIITISKWSLGALGQVVNMRDLARYYDPTNTGIVKPQNLREIYETPFLPCLIVLLSIIFICTIISIISIKRNTKRI